MGVKTNVDQDTHLNTKTNQDLTRGGWALVEAKSNPCYEDILSLTASDSGRNTKRKIIVSFASVVLIEYRKWKIRTSSELL
jgi:hypothetical protein